MLSIFHRRRSDQGETARLGLTSPPGLEQTSEVWCGRRPLPLAPSPAEPERGIEGVRPVGADGDQTSEVFGNFGSLSAAEGPSPWPPPRQSQGGGKRHVRRSKSPSLARLERGIEGERPVGADGDQTSEVFGNFGSLSAAGRPLPLAPSPAEPGRGKIRRLRAKSPSLVVRSIRS